MTRRATPIVHTAWGVRFVAIACGAAAGCIGVAVFFIARAVQS